MESLKRRFNWGQKLSGGENRNTVAYLPHALAGKKSGLAVRKGTGGRWCPYAHKKHSVGSSYGIFSGNSLCNCVFYYCNGGNFCIFIPLMHWEKIERDRKQLNISITKWEYAQELIIGVITPLILMGLGVRYLVELLDLKF